MEIFKHSCLTNEATLLLQEENVEKLFRNRRKQSKGHSGNDRCRIHHLEKESTMCYQLWEGSEKGKYAVWAIFAGLLESHGKSPDTESLEIFIVEFDAILMFCPLKVWTISDVNSPILLAPANNLILKSKVCFTTWCI